MGIERSTVSRTFSSVLDKIVSKSEDWIKFPRTIEDMDQANADWASKFRIPTVIGAIDCTHVHIIKPSEFGDDVDAQWPGSVHDGRIWRVSGIQDVVRRYDGDVCLLGDSGYGITPWLLTPFDEPRNARERNYNSTRAQERVIIERVFGQMERRFLILSSQIRIAVENVPNLVISCAMLHNVAKHLNDAWEEEDGIENGVAEENVPLYNLDRNEVINKRRDQQKRLEISSTPLSSVVHVQPEVLLA
ncbi:putative nuclease HARBI1 [Diorhabda carinulata]|uniref:putative nuclease HARBI1 n=1 Tax=Diorhabda carinulata TaxID=1163345 RepID=UPI0025A1AA36|nr:putative nuclease HARBI1 [Diorhabda carinulata]